MNPFAASLAFVFVMLPSLSDLHDNTHLDPMVFSPSGRPFNSLKVPDSFFLRSWPKAKRPYSEIHTLPLLIPEESLLETLDQKAFPNPTQLRLPFFPFDDQGEVVGRVVYAVQ